MSATHHLPPVDADSQAHSERVAACLRQRLAERDGWLPFDDFMNLALYAPGLGYYTAGNRKFAAGDAAAPGSDFVTAPELSPLFARSLAGPVAAVLRAADSTEVLEFGAGTGALAAGLIPALRDHGLEVSYRILEVSADLRQRQRERLSEFGAAVQWLDALPEAFRGAVLANEVLDAMPVRLFRWGPSGTVLERGVALAADQAAFVWRDRPAAPDFAAIVAERMPPLPGYTSEINLQAEAFMREMGQWLHAGAAFLIDYGFPRHEYYHPQRADGTLMCHFRHVGHADPLLHPGIQDITAHVDFTAMADAALAGGLDVLGYTSQARFLLNAGLPDWLQSLHDADEQRYLRSLNAVQKLISEAEMGELFKVLAVGRDLGATAPGFERGDRLNQL